MLCRRLGVHAGGRPREPLAARERPPPSSPAFALLAVVAWQSGAHGGPRRARDARARAVPCAGAGATTRVDVDTAEGRARSSSTCRPGRRAAAARARPARRRARRGATSPHDTGFSRARRPRGLPRRLPVGGRADTAVLEHERPGPGRPTTSPCSTRSLDQLEAAACVDAARVFVTGVSNGGGMTARLGCDLVRAPRRRRVRRRRLPLAAGLPARAPAAGARDPRHRRPGRAVRRQARPTHAGSVARWLCAVAAHRRLPGQGATGCEPAPGRDRDRLARSCSAGTRVEHVRLDGAGPRLARRRADRPAARALRGDVADVARSSAACPPPPLGAERVERAAVRLAGGAADVDARARAPIAPRGRQPVRSLPRSACRRRRAARSARGRCVTARASAAGATSWLPWPSGGSAPGARRGR